jgi:NodT family efflux transporter outer membrane factor (OMF) lipoprotein
MSRSLPSPLRPRLIVTLALAAQLGGCAVGPDFEPPKPAAPVGAFTPRAADSPTDSPPVALARDAVPSDWWRLFDDPLLASLQDRAAHANLDLRTAATRVAQSRAQLGVAAAALLPQVNAGASYAREAVSEDGLYAALGAKSEPYSLAQVGIDASWELDLWGHARRTQEQAAATAEATFHEQEAVRVAVAAEIARNYLLLRGVQAQQAIVRQNVEIAEHALQLAQSRERNGVATRFDAAAARAQLATTRAQLLTLDHHRDQAMNALALMLAEPPRALDAELGAALPAPGLPARLPVGVPSELARRRPDILEAEARLHAATAAIGAAQADFYPRVGLGGSLGLVALDESRLGDWSSRQFSVGPTIHLPIFEGGRLKSTLALTQARQQAAAIAYRKTVLNAWHEIDDALGAYATERLRHDELVTASEQNRVALELAQRAYQEGSADYLAVLVAQRNLLQSQSALADGATASGLALVDLYKSLAGAWSPALAAAPEHAS